MRRISSDIDDEMADLAVSDSEAPEDLVTSRVCLPSSIQGLSGSMSNINPLIRDKGRLSVS